MIAEMQFGSFWNWLARGLWKDLEMQVREALEYCEQCLMDDTCWSSEGQNIGENSDSENQAQEVSLGRITPLAVGLEIMGVTHQNNVYLCFVKVLGHFKRLGLRVMN